MRTTKLNRFLSLLLVLVMIMTLLPTAAFADAGTVSATRISAADELVTGQYVLVSSNNYAPTKLDDSWVLVQEVAPPY